MNIQNELSEEAYQKLKIKQKQYKAFLNAMSFPEIEGNSDGTENSSEVYVFLAHHKNLVDLLENMDLDDFEEKKLAQTIFNNLTIINNYVVHQYLDAKVSKNTLQRMDDKISFNHKTFVNAISLVAKAEIIGHQDYIDSENLLVEFAYRPLEKAVLFFQESSDNNYGYDH